MIGKKFKFLFTFSPYIFHIIYFNFKYLPFAQAIKLPILLYKPQFLKTKGKVSITSKKVSTGMIRLGTNTVSLYPRNGIIWENHGGICTFEGPCTIGNSSALSLGSNGNIKFGTNFIANAAFKISSYKQITFGENVQIGWENIFLDTDFHALTDLATGKHKKAMAPIIIGNNNWFGLRCTVLKGSETPDFCTVGANTLLNKKYDFETHSVIGGNPVLLKAKGVFWDPKNDKIKLD